MIAYEIIKDRGYMYFEKRQTYASLSKMYSLNYKKERYNETKKILISAICTSVIFAITSCGPDEKTSVSGEENNNNISEEKETTVTVDSIMENIELNCSGIEFNEESLKEIKDFETVFEIDAAGYIYSYLEEKQMNFNSDIETLLMFDNENQNALIKIDYSTNAMNGENEETTQTIKITKDVQDESKDEEYTVLSFEDIFTKISNNETGIFKENVFDFITENKKFVTLSEKPVLYNGSYHYELLLNINLYELIENNKDSVDLISLYEIFGVDDFEGFENIVITEDGTNLETILKNTGFYGTIFISQSDYTISYVKIDVSNVINNLLNEILPFFLDLYEALGLSDSYIEFQHLEFVYNFMQCEQNIE